MHNCRVTYGSMSFDIKAPNKFSFLGATPGGSFSSPCSPPLLHDFSASRRRTAIPRRMSAPMASASGSLCMPRCGWREVGGSARGIAARSRMSLINVKAKPSLELSHNRATSDSEPGAKLDRMSAANMPCIKKGLRVSTSASVGPVVWLGTGAIAKPTSRVRIAS